MRVLDLFCGGGGSSYGARNAGAEIVAGIDICPKATSVYAINNPNAITITGDIRSISPRRLRKKLGDIDLLLAWTLYQHRYRTIVFPAPVIICI